MSLKSTRKRLKDYLELLKYGADNIKHSSLLSKFGKNPSSQVNMYKIIKNAEESEKAKTNTTGVSGRYFDGSDRKDNYIEKTKRDRDREEAFDILFNEKSKNYKDKIRFSDDKSNINNEERGYTKSEQEKRKNQKRSKIRKILIAAIVEVFTLIVIISYGFFVRFTELKQDVRFDKSQVRNTNISETHLKAMQGFRTIAVFGLDSRTGSVGSGNNADVNIIVNIDLGTGAVKLVSIYRDLFANISDKNSYGKLNAAYSHGGPELAVKTLNKNFDLDITNYASFNWRSVALIIDLLEGIDLEITKSESKYMNSFIHETCKATGIDAKNPAGNYIKAAGFQHLNGVQAVAYARLRLMDSDFKRVERQKKVIELCLQKAKTFDITRLLGIASEAMQTVAFDIDIAELTSLIKNMENINIVESANIPDLQHLETVDMGPSGNCVVPKTLVNAAKSLHLILYGDENYEPSSALVRYSNRITELKNKYIEENRIKESIKQQEESLKAEENETDANGVVKKKTKKATSSIAQPKQNTEREILSPEENAPYEDEPISDDIYSPSGSGGPTAPYGSGIENGGAPISNAFGENIGSGIPPSSGTSGNVDIAIEPGAMSGGGNTGSSIPSSLPSDISSSGNVVPGIPRGATSTQDLPPGPPIG